MKNSLFLIRPSSLMMVPAMMVVSFAFYVMAGYDSKYFILFPTCLTTIIMGCMYLSLQAEDDYPPFFDIGLITAFGIYLYTNYPILNFVLGGFDFNLLSDPRLVKYHLSPIDMGLFHMRHVLYLLSFVVLYLMLRKGCGPRRMAVRIPCGASQKTLVMAFVALMLFFAVIKVVFGLEYLFGSYESDAFMTNEGAFAEAPLIVKQICNRLVGILQISKIAILALVILKIRNKRWKYTLAIWIVFEMGMTLWVKGGRGNLVFFMMAVILLYHQFVKRIPLRRMAAMFVCFLVVFNLLGMYRAYTSVTDLQSSHGETSDYLTTMNEFQAILGTSYDVLQMKNSGTQIPGILYFNDIMGVLPPQQMLPFEKVTGAEWYKKEIKVENGGFMWGAITQAIIGFDWYEIPLRGAVLGALLAFIYNKYRSHEDSFFALILYLFLCIKSYNSFRDTSFVIVNEILFVLVPVYLLRIVYEKFSKGTATKPLRQLVDTA